ncbi:MAG TPA: fatty acid desaturase [Steroidobacteraceae bacterium]|nr:fatty acid desaturase [Steroidobacteraceae bacterium]
MAADALTPGSDAALPGEPAPWRAMIARHRQPNAWKASWQLINSLGLYVLVWVLYHYSLRVSWWLVPPLVVLGAGLLVRTFIIFHDCGHGSFFASRLANDVWGCICGVLTFTPYYQWRGEHAIHHGTAGDLDKRGTGDVWTMTVTEYLHASGYRRFAYRLARSPFVLFIISPVVLFLVLQRIPDPKMGVRERHSVWSMNVALLLLGATLSTVIGLWAYLVFQFAILTLAGSAGLWLFYVQHQFEEAYWERGESWDYTAAALKGSSYFKLPRVLQWFSGNIGFHHIHHLGPRIPNYNLEQCHRSELLFRDIKPLTFSDSLRTLSLRLWDESSKRLVGFRSLKQASAAPTSASHS